MELGCNFSLTKTKTYYVIAIVIVLSEGGWKVANPILSSLLAALYFHIDSVLQPSDDFAKYASVAMLLSFRLRSISKCIWEGNQNTIKYQYFKVTDQLT